MTTILAQRDPIGIGGDNMGIPATEYESEAQEIVRRVFKADEPTAGDVRRIVNAVLVEAFSEEDVDSNELASLSREIHAAVGRW